MYGKLIDSQLHMAPIEFVEDDKHIRGFTDSFLRERGYKPVIFSDQEPTEDMVPVHEETEDSIIQRWTEPSE